MAPKDHILNEIRRLAVENGGTVVGQKQFTRLTGITKYAWGTYWARWNDAVREAGLEPNTRTVAFGEEAVLRLYIELARSLERVPTEADLRLARGRDSRYPSKEVFRRLGSKKDLIEMASQFCEADPNCGDVAPIFSAARPSDSDVTSRPHASDVQSIGFVYLARGHPGEFKIGRTNLVDRRLSELGATAAVEPTLVHEIKTDDPAGVEAYWHRRFADKRLRGEWFRLSAADVAAFRRWRRIA